MSADSWHRWLTHVRPRCVTLAEARTAEALAWYGTHCRKAAPSIATLAQHTGMCERSVKYATAGLVAAGMLWRHVDPAIRRRDGSYTRARCNLYRPRFAPKGQVRPRGNALPLKAICCSTGRRRATAPRPAHGGKPPPPSPAPTLPCDVCGQPVTEPGRWRHPGCSPPPRPPLPRPARVQEL